MQREGFRSCSANAYGEEMVVMVPAEEYRRTEEKKPDFKEFLLSGPDLSVLDLERSKEMPRDVDL